MKNPDIRFTNTPPEHLRFFTASSKAGDILVAITPKREIARIGFLAHQKAKAHLREWREAWPQTTFEALGSDIPDYTRLSVLLVGTDFQHRVWSALLDIPEGQVRTYGELAAQIGKKGAARAVGTALGANPVPLLIPCHRIVSTAGLGGFSCGLKLKKVLLEVEKALR